MRGVTFYVPIQLKTGFPHWPREEFALQKKACFLLSFPIFLTSGCHLLQPVSVSAGEDSTNKSRAANGNNSLAHFAKVLTAVRQALCSLRLIFLP